MTYLLFVWTATGYELREQDGDPPSVGEQVEVDEQPLSITKIGVSPLPGDNRVCAFSMG